MTLFLVEGRVVAGGVWGKIGVCEGVGPLDKPGLLRQGRGPLSKEAGLWGAGSVRTQGRLWVLGIWAGWVCCRRVWLFFGGGEAFADGVFGEVGQVVDVEFVGDVLAVGLYGFDAQVQLGGDLLAVFAFGEELEDFALAG